MNFSRTATFIAISIIACLSYTQTYAQQCDQKQLDESQAAFIAMLEEKENSDQNLSFTQAEYQTTALRYVEHSERCYLALRATATGLSVPQTIKIDDGALIPNPPAIPQFGPVPDPLDYTFFPDQNKWGSSAALGTSGGTVSYSFMASSVNIHDGGDPTVNTAVTDLPGYQVCFIAEIVAAFAAWSAISDIEFVEVVDNGLSTNNPGANGLIRIGAHAFDGSGGVLAHAWAPLLQNQHFLFPDAGDMHFDTAENWTCDASGFDIGVVALHEIGHSIGLAHSTVLGAVMYPFYSSALTMLQADDVAGAQALYGPNVVTLPEYIFIKYGDYPVPILQRN